MQSVTIEPEKYVDFAASSIHHLINDLLKSQNEVNIALSGGNSPLPVYKKLSTYALEWERLHFFMVDERSVPIDHKECNYKNISENLFNKVTTNAYSVINTQLNITESAKSYECLLQEKLKTRNGYPQFDLIILGMGLDGHTASLFPETKALLNTSDSYVVNFVPQLNTYRLTMTYPLIMNSRKIVLLAQGNKKKEILDKAEQNSLPIAKIIPVIDVIIN